MNVKSFIYIVAAIAGMSLFTACQSDDTSIAEANEKELTLYPTVSNMGQQILTRAAANNFFKSGDEVTVKVTTNRLSGNKSSHTYSYDATGTFSGINNPFRFKLDNTYITQLVASWPTDAIRTEGIITDQRKFEEYRKADWLSAEAKTTNILPTAEPVPLLFEHEQSRLTFRVAGQNAYGIDIKDLIVELDAVLEEGKGAEKAAFRAHCKADGTAELILPAGTKIAPDGTEGSRSLIGLVTLDSRDEAVKDYRGSIYIPGNTNITLKKNTDYLVTLTPQGYDLYAQITINGFSQGEGYVGIPIQMPKKMEGEEEHYSIDTPLQLVTLSLLLQGYIKSEEAVAGEWNTYTYTLKEGLVMTENAKLYYKPIAASLKGIFGKDVTSVKDTRGEDFNLFAD